jgi:glycosyltransferase involved in cell wall biosynthesis
MKVRLCLDASRCRSGGAKVHMEGLLHSLDLEKYPFDEVHVFSYKSLLDSLPNRPWLIKKSHPFLEKSLLFQILWQMFILPFELIRLKASLLFTIDASSVCLFRPQVSLSQDLLAYEKEMITAFPFGYDKLRLYSILFLQNRTFKRSRGVIFLSKYAKQLTEQYVGKLNQTIIIPHGLSDSFKKAGTEFCPRDKLSGEVKCVYVSHVEIYKNQWNVIKAIAELREEGVQATLTLIGGDGSTSEAKNLLSQAIQTYDPQNSFVTMLGSVENSELPNLLKRQDIFVFASSCENMPNTLVEGMAVGVPIACSNSGPMPEILDSGGVYFDPKSSKSIKDGILSLVKDDQLRFKLSERAKLLASQYSWERCSRETFDFLAQNLRSKAYQNSYCNAFLFLVYLVVIRFYITAATGIPSFSRIFLTLPFVFLFSYFLVRPFKLKEIWINDHRRLNSLCIIILTLHFIISFFYFDAPLNVLVTHGLPVVYFPLMIIPLAIFLGSYQVKQSAFLSFACSVVWICGLLVIGEYLLESWDLLPAVILQGYLAESSIFYNWGTSVSSISANRFGPLIVSSTSGALLVCVTTYVYSRMLLALKEKAPNVSQVIFYGATISIGAVSVIYTDSITSLLSLSAVGVLGAISFVWSSSRKGIFSILTFVAFMILSLIFFKSSTYERILNYATTERELVLNSIPLFTDCSLLESLWIKDFGESNTCDLGEVHLLKKIFNSVGLIPMLPWVIWFLIPAFLFLKRGRWSDDFLRPDFLSILSLYFCSIHYSPVESWGINFIFFYLVISYMNTWELDG